MTFAPCPVCGRDLEVISERIRRHYWIGSGEHCSGSGALAPAADLFPELPRVAPKLDALPLFPEV